MLPNSLKVAKYNVIINAEDLRHYGSIWKFVEWSCFTNACHSNLDLGVAAPALPLFSSVSKENCTPGHLLWAEFLKRHRHVLSLS